MFEHSPHRIAKNRTIVFLGVALALGCWLAEGMVHFSAFERVNVVETLVPSNIPELLTRLVTICIIAGFSVYAQLVVNRLSKSNTRYRALFENSPDAIFLADAESGVITDANPAASRLLLRPHDEIVGVHQSMLHPPAKRDDSTRIFGAQVEGRRQEGGPQPVQHVVLRSDGTEVPVEITAQTTDLAGRLMLQGIFRDITERKEAEDALQESEQRFRAVFDNVADGILLADAESKQLHLGNGRICQMLGYGQDELVNLGVADIHPGQAMPHVIEEFEKQVRGESTLAQDLPVKRKNGSVFYADVSAFPITLDGRYYLAGVFRDVSERRKADEALRQSEQRYRSVVEDSPILLCSFLPDGQIAFVNRAYCTYFGKTTEELVGKNFKSLIPEEDRQAVLDSILSLTVDSGLMTHEHKVLAPDGQIRWQRWTNRALFDEHGRAVSFQSFGEDITERKKTEWALLESEERYRTLVESSNEAIVTVDEHGVFLFMNTKAAADWGGKLEHLTGKRTMWDIFPKETADRHVAAVREVIHTGRRTNQLISLEANGCRRWYNVSLEPLRDASGTITAAMVIAADMTESRQMQEELDRFHAEMSRAEHFASVATLSATAAHELAQPLTVMRLSTENALDELNRIPHAGMVTKKLSTVLREISGITLIVERFRRFARRSPERTVSEVDLQVVGERIATLLQGQAGQARVTVRFEGMERLPSIYSNEKDLEQIFFALIHNALGAAGDNSDGRELVISGAVRDGHVELRFSDNCGGIAPENLGKIFEPFFTTKPPGQGTGLGLCVVEDIVHRAGGTVRVESTFGEGSTFFVTLPVNKDQR